jgi:NCS1 family nucleobase:cation symporter-1
MFQLDGVYGRFRWGALAVYLLSIICQIPFMNLSFYAGPVARMLGADIAWIPGLLIPTVLYIAVEKAQRSASRQSGANSVLV